MAKGPKIPKSQRKDPGFGSGRRGFHAPGTSRYLTFDRALRKIWLASVRLLEMPNGAVYSKRLNLADSTMSRSWTPTKPRPASPRATPLGGSDALDCRSWSEGSFFAQGMSED